MPKKPIIGITANQRPNPAAEDISWSYVPSGFVNGVRAAGGLPLVLPVGSPETASDYVSMFDKLILIGGQNVDPSFYGEKKQASENDFFKERDIFELALIEETTKQKKAIFSVCRGTQLMNVALGGSLHQDIENHWQDSPADYLSHDMIIKKDSKLADIYGLSSSINSFHHQSINHLASELRVIAKDPKDGTIEAVESINPNMRFLGVQWHPELLYESRKEDLDLFKYVVSEL
ncbi:gamma-glutamyl-gamma-aminobutyrate hydrolase family protein [Streptococcus chenjunshii]|uniref:Gamma-glutamyl-gamma-aminobutyrate hydrolase family protein n=1 Tax=Streptococcus chenjunshii TaxID=2173853 RepID=A0A372KQ31_9STRE|nr:gamma-glutamyl-gamma-aminobutyrate hydrolase family protein [Streptococcus chenjunshii]AXQ78642.1 gamma-glutamyl-gamma-aminobutyrate hydrolase family protein [Streptococcus chenjunshii]RFU51894.1 gamma-glutamyl-gamma-aminobutyrate hydrolase family protein [Streptococcus chenjunshii]RFU54086.1 gamma-glutamyl-gamma-aminobutyrate hydrolase family protein [Streptococcus chenjunshii]